MTTPPLRLEAGDRLGEYVVEQAEPRGQLGVALDDRLGRRVHLQLLADLRTVSSSQREAFDLQMRARSAVSHPHLADLLAIETEGARPFVAFEYRGGELLDHWLERQPSRFSGAPQEMLAALALGLADATSASLEHTGSAPDVAADNILLVEGGGAVLLARSPAWPHEPPTVRTASPAERRALDQLGELMQRLLEISACQSVGLRQLSAACRRAGQGHGALRLREAVRQLRQLAREPVPEGLGDDADITLEDELGSDRLHAWGLALAALMTLVLLGLLAYVLILTG